MVNFMAMLEPMVKLRDFFEAIVARVAGFAKVRHRADLAL